MDHHYSAAPVVGTAIGKCPLTVEQLEKHLKQSGYGRDKDHYLCYFMEGKPPRCVVCNEHIAFHEHEGPTWSSTSSGEHRSSPPIVRSGSARSTSSTQRTIGDDRCFLCAERNEKELLRNKKEGDLDATPDVPTLDKIAFRKLLSTTEFRGTYGCCIDEPLGCCGWAEKPVERPTCDECGIQAKLTHPLMDEAEKADVDVFWAAHPDLEFRGCEQCNRVVCSYCFREGRHMRPKSRFNPTEPEWRTSLFGCCASPRILCNTMWCYGVWFHESSAVTCQNSCLKSIIFEQQKLREHILRLSESYGLWFLLAASTMIPVAPLLSHIILVIVDPLLCITNRCMRHRDQELRLRFGLQPHSTAEIIFCRYCVYMRQFREAEARGFPQPTACTFYSDLPGMLEPPSSAPTQPQNNPPTPREMH